MKRPLALWAALITAGLLVTSCAGVSLSRLQNDFNQLYQEKEACRSAKPTMAEEITNVKSIPCTEQAEAALFDLSQSAKSAADKAKDQRTKVALLRLAGLSLWQSGRGAEKEGNAFVNKVSMEGEIVCDAIEEKAKKGEIYGAPRDCALLTILQALVWHSEYKNRLEKLDLQKPSEESKKEFESLIGNYANNTVLFISTREKKAKAFTGLSSSVKDYIDEAKRRSFCNFQKAEEIALDHTIYQDLESKIDNQFQTMSRRTGLNRADDCQ
jgi:hypothetical protein